MDDCIADCPNEKALKRRNLTPEEWWALKVDNIKVNKSARRGQPSFLFFLPSLLLIFVLVFLASSCHDVVVVVVVVGEKSV